MRGRASAPKLTLSPTRDMFGALSRRRRRLQRFKALVDAAVFLDIPQYQQPEPRTYLYRAAAQVMADRYGAEWDPDCVAAQAGLQAGLSVPLRVALCLYTAAMLNDRQ